MKRVRHIFHKISYLQYAFNLAAVFYMVKFYYRLLVTGGLDAALSDINKGLMFMGIAISFSTLQDFTKTQNNFSKRIWESRRKGKVAIIVIIALTLVCMIFGLLGLFRSNTSGLQEVSLGFIVLGMGTIGLLKVAVEMYEHHRKE